MAKRKSTGKVYRSKTDFSVMDRKQELSVRIGPGKLLTEEEYRALTEAGAARADWFEEMPPGQKSGESER